MISKSDLDTWLLEITETSDLKKLEQLRVRLLGKKGEVTKALRELGSVSDVKQRARRGAELNDINTALREALATKNKDLLRQQDQQQQEQVFVDPTAPGTGPSIGHLHPVESLQKELVELFWQLGFQVASGPEIETDWYNFEALRVRADHPARDMQDTFYLTNGLVPRTHTSSVQIRYMESHRPPIRIIAPGNVYRNEDEDVTHAWLFRQLEGLVVDEKITLSDLKGTLLYMLRGIFGEQTEIKLLPNYFPYTEPSLEVHARINPNQPWLELAGAGMVHPEVLQNVGIDPTIYSGFAFGFGIDRLALIKHGVNDLRHFWRPDLRFLEQF